LRNKKKQGLVKIKTKKSKINYKTREKYSVITAKLKERKKTDWISESKTAWLGEY